MQQANETRGTIFDAMCGPGPVNLGGILTVRHSALRVVYAHSCCFEPQMTCIANRQTSAMMCRFSSSAVVYPCIPSTVMSPVGTFESLDHFGSLECGRASLFSNGILTTTQVFTNRTNWCLWLFGQVSCFKRHTHPTTGKIYLLTCTIQPQKHTTCWLSGWTVAGLSLGSSSWCKILWSTGLDTHKAGQPRHNKTYNCLNY